MPPEEMTQVCVLTHERIGGADRTRGSCHTLTVVYVAH